MTATFARLEERIARLEGLGLDTARAEGTQDEPHARKRRRTRLLAAILMMHAAEVLLEDSP